jgi:hypothetical protein
LTTEAAYDFGSYGFPPRAFHSQLSGEGMSIDNTLCEFLRANNAQVSLVYIITAEMDIFSLL